MNLSDLMGGVRRALEAGFNGHTFRIIAETTDVKIYHNRQYVFLNLIEKQGSEIAAAAGAVIWRDHFHLIKDFENISGIAFEQNLPVVLEVEIQFHERYILFFFYIFHKRFFIETSKHIFKSSFPKK